MARCRRDPAGGHRRRPIQPRPPTPHRPPTEIDLARFDLWTEQILVDVAAETAGAVAGDIATLDWIRDRLIRAVDPSTADQIDLLLIDLRTAVDGGNLSVVAGIATQLGDLIA